MSDIDFAWADPTVNLRQDDRRHITFHVEAEKDETLSGEAGRPIHKDVDYVTIVNPGSRDSHITRAITFIKMNPKDELVRKKYLEWKEAEKKNVIVGTPLAEIPFLGKSEVADFRAMNIHSAEQLVEINETAKQKMAGVGPIIAKVKAYLAQAADTALATKQAAVIDNLNQQIDALKNQINDINSRFNDAVSKATGKK